MLAGIPKPPPVLVATEGWAPNAALARRRLAPLGGVGPFVAHSQRFLIEGLADRDHRRAFPISPRI